VTWDHLQRQVRDPWWVVVMDQQWVAQVVVVLQKKMMA
jgi:hypothetical protein